MSRSPQQVAEVWTWYRQQREDLELCIRGTGHKWAQTASRATERWTLCSEFWSIYFRAHLSAWYVHGYLAYANHMQNSPYHCKLFASIAMIVYRGEDWCRLIWWSLVLCLVCKDSWWRNCFFRFHFHLFQLILLKSPSLPPFSVYRCVRYWKETGVHAYYHYCIHCPTCQGTAHMEYATWYGVCMLYAVNLQISSLIASSTGS